MDEKEREREFYRRLQEDGLWTPRAQDQRPPGEQTPFEPIKIKGKPLSHMIIEARR